MRLLCSSFALVLAAACSSAPTPKPQPAGGELPPTPGGDSRCPAVDAPCMNADNHAACLKIAATCTGEIAQLESCPLQFACDDKAASAPSGTPYEPCAGKSCGDSCNVCPPDDTDCVETAVLKMCGPDGGCSSTSASCE